MRKSAEEAQRTRERIVDAGVHRTSINGISGVSIGDLASVLGMSKAGVVGPFGSQEQLQLAVIQRARETFVDAVVRPGMRQEGGLPRLRATVRAWCRYLGDGTFPGGCFVTAASTELDGRPGVLRDAVRDVVVQWRGFLREQISTAQTNGQLVRRRNPDDLVSTLNGIAMAANQEIQLLRDTTAARRAARLMLAQIDAWTREGR
ncbi:TetR family transcriptional regulator [Flexivirga endophytica]|uniref:TetR family transcriptional regulator n=1 Tax=Flexivirga endophytica TaxID=1849103 RepID=A0A916SXX5_9MICO|nr:TetR/AcrR family transcriptional regulator [Flexivirga endophytica]GGB18952.1 TetR family transcriptional regulator [Flexivirga endophytica]GHB36702.1 TetR family transcriptional regulator [Flexivirga endophytica]